MVIRDEGRYRADITDALSYLDAVKREFVGQPEVYEAFMSIMRDFKDKTCVRLLLVT
jgi:histone deacetylase complex regulatory component SIN3